MIKLNVLRSIDDISVPVADILFDLEQDSSLDSSSGIVVWPSDKQEYFETLCSGVGDGRGIPMGDGSYTPLGVVAALEQCGYTVIGHEDMRLDPDADGLE